MTHILESADWSSPALALLSSFKKLDPFKPIIMHIRHTERFEPTENENSNLALSTSRGKQAALEFGESLPLNRRYRLYHTHVGRAKETAEGIRMGIVSRGGNATIVGIIPASLALDNDACQEYIRQLQKKYGKTEGVVKFVYRWCAGLIPPKIACPSYEFSQTVASYTFSNLRRAPTDTVDIYISHDTWIAALLFHWFGEPLPEDGINFLEGFIMQPRENDITLYVRDRKIVVEYPYWWSKL